jgi:phage-related protein
MTAFSSVTASSSAVLQNGTILQKFVTILSAGFKGLWAVIKAHPIAAIITAIVACITAVVKLYKNSEEFRNFVSNLWNVLKSILGEIGDSLKDLWNNHILPLWKELQPLFQAVGDAFGALWDTISTIIGWIVGVLGGALLTGVTSAFKAVVNIITNAIASITDIIRGII